MQMQLLTVRDAAAILKVSCSLVYQLVAAGKLPCYRIGTGRGAIRIRSDDLETYVAACRTDPADVSPTIPKTSRVQGRAFTHLDGERLLAAWHRKGVDVDRPNGRSVPPSE